MAYLGKSPNGSGVRTKFVYTASGSETSLSGADDNGNTLKFSDGEYVDVYLNGVLLVHGSDYGTGTTNTISSLNALTASDVVEILVYDIFTMAKVNSEVIRSRYYKTASGSETSISGADDSGATITFAANAEIEVKVNGVSLVQGTDYNTSSANTVGGLSALSAGQVVEIIVYSKFTLGDTVSKADGGTFSGNIGINGDLTVDTTTLKVDSSNNRVGIGTASPAVLIHGTASAPELRITSSSDSNTPAARMFYTAGSGWNFRLGDAANNEDVKISTHGVSYFNAGNVGIGTSSPAMGLHISGSASSNNHGMRVTNADASGWSTIQMYDANAGIYRNGSSQTAYGGASSLNLITVASHPIAFSTSNTVRMTIKGNGNVGIGTTDNENNAGRELNIKGGTNNTGPAVITMQGGSTSGAGMVMTEVFGLVSISSAQEITRITGTGSNGFRMLIFVTVTGHTGSLDNGHSIGKYYWDGGTNTVQTISLDQNSNGNAPVVSFDTSSSNVCIVKLASGNGSGGYNGVMEVKWYVPIDFSSNTWTVN